MRNIRADIMNPVRDSETTGKDVFTRKIDREKENA